MKNSRKTERELELIRQSGIDETQAWIEDGCFNFRDHAVMVRAMDVLAENPPLQRFCLKDQDAGKTLRVTKMLRVGTMASCLSMRSDLVAAGRDTTSLTIHRFDPLV